MSVLDLLTIVSIVIILLVLFFFLANYFFSKTDYTTIESAEKRAGRQGERFASQVIREILNEKDVLLTNVKIAYEGKKTELDNVIINNRGVFIIEVKNYSGALVGGEDDYEWIQSKFTYAGNYYHKQVKNPIRQVKRQIYILSGLLKKYGFDVWVEGYAFLVEMNSPVESEHILRTQKDISEAIHSGTNNNLKERVKIGIVELLS